ncbi:class I SAM-dependent methyltransferase [Streptomyces inhibens]|uniref:Class I SAM-dependent methyltransferase n=1 Tax=Streptomyces inhibens TaxID=2293571 RepID=A0A371PWM0_STRIH|nr:class I SAM-dependent methyltransferase [Streptomyces inhibens]REK86872.1 class I SAM-dependent methyltransferase [Streptomyces inhibens]
MLQRRRIPQGTVHHPVFARFYASCCGPAADARAGVAGLRKELLTGAIGRVIEVGAGPGLNFPHYPGTVSEVVAIEPESTLREVARSAAAHVEVPVDVVPGVAEALPVKSEAFDTAVASLVLCSVRDVQRALMELRRVLRPGGELRFFEHGRAAGRGLAAVQWSLDHTVWPLLMGGCHTGRDPLGEIRGAGFEVVRMRRLKVPERGPTLPTSPAVLGVARRPGN